MYVLEDTGGSSGGTSDYTDLENKPSINGVTLEGNLTTQELGVDKHFKGWYDSLNELKATYTATQGDSAYVKDASPATTWSIYVYDATATTDNNWADSGTDADTSNVQTFASGEEVNETYIDDTHLANPKEGALPTAADVMQLKAKLKGVTASELRVTQQPITGSYIKGSDGSIVSSNNTAYLEIALGNVKSVRFLGGWYTSSYASGYAFGHYTDPSDPTTWVTDKSSVFDTNASTLGTKEYIIAVPEGATHFRTTTATSKIPALAQNFYCYLTSGKSVGDELDGLKKASYISYPFSYNGSVSNTGSYDSSSSYKMTDYIVIQGGEEYYGYGNSTSRSFISFYDANKTWISSINASGGMRKYILDSNNIPSNAVYFRAGTSSSNLSESYVNQPMQSIASHLDGFSKDINLVRNEISKIDGYLSSQEVTVTSKKLEVSVALPYQSAYIMVKCDTPPTSTFKIGRRTNYTRTVSTYLSSCNYNEWIRVDQDNTNGNILYIFTSTSGTISTQMTIIYRSVEENIEDRLGLLENIAAGIKGKNIVVFGDSLSEFKYTSGDNKRWTDHAQEISGANFINVAIGGTKLHQRYNKMPTVFDSTKTYTVGDWVFYKPSTTMNCYECTTQHTGEWSDNDFSEVEYTSYLYAQLDMVSIISAISNTAIETYADRLVNQVACAQCIADHSYGDDNTAIIQRLVDIDWATIDAVIIMGGANDFGDTMGDTDSSSKRQVLGAINEIVKAFSTAYKSIPLYYVSSTVRWKNYSGGGGSDEDWCDVYTEGGLTYTQFFDALMNQFKLNHSPYCDLYHSLGWNKYNFSNYFTEDDGTHPLKGFRQMAYKIVSFIIANRVF